MQERIRVTLYPEETDPYGVIAGGTLASYIDIAGAESARAYAVAAAPALAVNYDFVTRWLQVEFTEPVYVGDTLICSTETTGVGRSSVSSEVAAYARRGKHRTEVKAASAKIVMVSVANDSKVEHHLPQPPGQSGVPTMNSMVRDRQIAVTNAAELCSQRVMMMPRHTNPRGDIFGGVLAAYIDRAAAEFARELRARTKAALVDEYLFVTRILEVNYLAPVQRGDTLGFYTKETSLGTHSLVTEVRVTAERGRSRAEISVATGRVVLVAVDKNRNLVPHKLAP